MECRLQSKLKAMMEGLALKHRQELAAAGTRSISQGFLLDSPSIAGRNLIQ